MKVLKRLTAVLLATVMMVSMGLSVFAAAPGNYNVDMKLYKEKQCVNLSMGNNGIDSITATVNNDTVNIVLKTKPVTYKGETGQLDAVTFYDTSGEPYVGTQIAGDDLTFYINNFPAEDFQTNSVIRGLFKSFVSIMGEKTGYFKVHSMTMIQ